MPRRQPGAAHLPPADRPLQQGASRPGLTSPWHHHHPAGGALNTACSNGPAATASNHQHRSGQQGRGVTARLPPAPGAFALEQTPPCTDARPSRWALGGDQAANRGRGAPLHAKRSPVRPQPQGLQTDRAHPGAQSEHATSGQLPDRQTANSHLPFGSSGQGIGVCLQPRGPSRGRTAAAPRIGTGREVSADQDHQMQRFEIGGERDRLRPQAPDPLVGCRAVRQSQTHRPLPSREARRIRRTSSAPPRPGSVEHRQALAAAASPAGPGVRGSPARAGLIQLASLQGRRFAATPALQGWKVQDENEAALTGLACNSSRPMPNQSGSHRWPADHRCPTSSQGGSQAPGSADRACRCVAARLATPQTAQRPGGARQQLGPVAPGPQGPGQRGLRPRHRLTDFTSSLASLVHEISRSPRMMPADLLAAPIPSLAVPTAAAHHELVLALVARQGELGASADDGVVAWRRG